MRRFLRDLGVAFRSIDLDSVAMQADGLGGDLRKALHALTSQRTIPQIFIGGAHIGGAMDILDLHDRGELVTLLAKAGVAPSGDPTIIARSYLPKWLAARRSS